MIRLAAILRLMDATEEWTLLPHRIRRAAYETVTDLTELESSERMWEEFWTWFEERCAEHSAASR